MDGLREEVVVGERPSLRLGGLQCAAAAGHNFLGSVAVVCRSYWYYSCIP